MSDVDERTRKALEALGDRLSGEIPVLRLIFDQIRNREISVHEGMEKINSALVARPDLVDKIQVVVNPEGMVPYHESLPSEVAKEKSEQVSRSLASVGLKLHHVVFKDRVTGEFRLNPIFEGAVMERLQFDGDIPELRFGGDMPEGATPAVPVETSAMSAVVLGHQLQTSSQEVGQEMKELKEKREREADLAIIGFANKALSASGSDETALARSSSQNALAELDKPLNVPGYEGGKPAAMRKVEGPTTQELATMPEEKRQELAWKAFSTTQGRRSAIPGIGERIAQSLTRGGYRVEYVPGWSIRHAVAMAQWSSAIHGQDMNPNFSPINVSLQSMVSKLGSALDKSLTDKDTKLDVEVKSVDDYGNREVGWRAQIVLRQQMTEIPEISGSAPGKDVIGDPEDIWAPRGVYNLQAMGGDPFVIQAEGNPPFEHDGEKSVTQLLLTTDQYMDLQSLVESHGAQLINNEVMTDVERLQEFERRKRSKGIDSTIFWTTTCPGCMFCDIEEGEGEMICGVDGWPKESIVEILKQDKGKKDMENCPMGKKDTWQS